MKKMTWQRIKKVGELIPYNIVPLEAPSLNNSTEVFPEVRGAISAIKYTEHFPRLPADFEISGVCDADMLDLLEYVFGFQLAFEKFFVQKTNGLLGLLAKVSGI
ncbi:callose synthase 10-like [Hevea brasiliensis]|uniref:callose synthase 10-like n=1 Tax=Hevea brasiliensis TaxID=3981 RepID=UPI0025E6A7E7|nr:callose synthase 10-like [Hevea brasiliensis]